MYVHVSKPPKEGSTARRFLESLQVVGRENGVDVQLVHSKINIAEFLLSRTSKGNNAFSIVKVDEKISDKLMVTIEKLDEIINIMQLEV